MKRNLLFFACLSLSTSAFSASIWTDVPEPAQKNLQQKLASPSYISRELTLDDAALKKQLSAGDKLQLRSAEQNAVAINNPVIELPLPDGSMLNVTAEEYSLLDPALAAKFPQIQTWKIRGADNNAISGRIDFTDNGFSAMVILENGDTVFIDPSKDGSATSQNKHYNSFSKTKNKHLFIRSFREKEILIQRSSSKNLPQTSQRLAAKPAKSLKTYRLALAATGEYTNLRGGSKTSALSSMATTINRVNAIYERDLSISLELVNNTESLVYTNAATDPFTNGNAYAMLDENIATMESQIGNANYDIGHLFGGAGTGGLALMSGVCQANQASHKAGGITGSSSPYGETFDIDYVAHEMGHQFGATHTFNSTTESCGGYNREEDTAVEPGSGSTIMSYAGICGTNDLQYNSDAVFNAVSIAQIDYYIRESGQANCGTSTTDTNNEPTISIASSFNIPINTPFLLTSEASDADGDTLRFTWDQMDSNGTPVDADIDTGDNPLFRSYLPTSSNSRYFPSISTLFGDIPIKGETLPLTSRELNFAATVRDYRGGIARADTKITTSGTPFTLTSHTTAYLYNAGDSFETQWDVAGTNSAPINCSAVDIKLLANNGSTQDLLLNTTNDGSATVTIPHGISSTDKSRLMVACRNNIFFALSDSNVAVNGSNPVVTLNSPSITEGDTEVRLLNYVLSLSAPITVDATVQYAIIETSSGSQISSGTIRIPAGNTEVQFNQSIQGNLVEDGDRSYEFILSSPQNIQFDASGQQTILSTTGTVIDNDSGAVYLTIGNVTVNEGDSGTATLSFNVNLNRAMDKPTSISYTTSNETATAGSDYLAQSGIIFIAAGKTSESVKINVTGDTVDEDNETFRITLSNASDGVELINTYAIATIIDDDTSSSTNTGDKVVPETSSNTSNGSSGGGSFGFILTLLLIYLKFLNVRFHSCFQQRTRNSFSLINPRVALKILG